MLQLYMHVKHSAQKSQNFKKFQKAENDYMHEYNISNKTYFTNG